MMPLWLYLRLGFRRLLGIRDMRASRLQAEIRQAKERRWPGCRTPRVR